MLAASFALHLGWFRLGQNGPLNGSNTVMYPPSQFRLVDASGVDDYLPSIDLTVTHSYYRHSKIVRSDIVLTMLGAAAPPGGEVNL